METHSLSFPIEAVFIEWINIFLLYAAYWMEPPPRQTGHTVVAGRAYILLFFKMMKDQLNRPIEALFLILLNKKKQQLN